MANKIIQIPFNASDFKFCEEHGYKQSASIGHSYFLTIDYRKPNPEKYKIGLVGELAYSKYTGMPVDTHTLGHGDGGIDFENGVDVKCSKLDVCPNLLMMKRDIKEKTKFYVLAWWKNYGRELNVDEVYLIGWISKEDFIQKHEKVNYGFGTSMRLHSTLLHPMHTFNQIKLQF